jgi:hypothetical protein
MFKKIRKKRNDKRIRELEEVLEGTRIAIDCYNLKAFISKKDEKELGHLKREKFFFDNDLKRRLKLSEKLK